MERGNQYLKLVDRYCGIPLLFLLRFFRKKRLAPPATINRIAVIKGAAIGDTVLLSAIVNDIRKTLPTVELLFFCGKTCVGIAEMIPGIDRVVFIPTTKPFFAIRTLRQAGQFDLVIDTGPWTRLEALFAFFTKGKFKIGFHSLNQHRHFCYDFAATHSNRQHELANNRELLKPFIQRPDSRPALVVPSLDVASLQAQLGIDPNRPCWILHPWSGGFKGEHKEWVADRWVAVANWLTEQGCQVVFSGAKANTEATDSLVALCQNQYLSIQSIAGKTSLAELLTLIRVSAGVISVNTGVLHIAATTATPVVGINGPVPTLRWGAVSEKAINIDCKPPLEGYIHLGFEYPKHPPDCMGSIEVTDVIEAVQTISQAAAR
jgi:ADP-heptose:LPS heptosyltransferase